MENTEFQKLVLKSLMVLLASENKAEKIETASELAYKIENIELMEYNNYWGEDE